MSEKFFPKISFTQNINGSKIDTNLTPMRTDAINSDDKLVTFSDTMNNMVKDLNETANAPDVAMQDMIAGNGTDIHDVMLAISKAELSVNVATQVTTKVVQACEKIMAIQV